ncbi:hypothetical protein V8E52_010163 [Russula decolorans]
MQRILWRKAWVEDYKHWSYEAAHHPANAVYKQETDNTHGWVGPVALTLERLSPFGVLLLPMGRAKTARSQRPKS